MDQLPNHHWSQEQELTMKLFIVLSRAYKALMEHSQRDVQRHGLNDTEFAVLELLYHKGPHPLQQIGDKILLASGSVTYVIDQLSKKGFLRRRPCEKDRRVIYAELEEKGRLLLDDIFPAHVEALLSATASLTIEEKAQAAELMKKLGLGARSRLNA
ncbi:MarR family winged helix-turn-helix transcriptional regulator [Paenibacillus sp. y28]|uniref:MarR family winged helix-turn-helix transcriptional regulator n=1 Tax=Paenibacillus sp. y28 TaxID=3129110 RepID=UPI003018CF43